MSACYQVFGALTGPLSNWLEHNRAATLITVGSSDLVYLKKSKNQRMSLVKSKIGIRKSHSEDKDNLIGYAMLHSAEDDFFLTLSKNGAIYRIIINGSDPNDIELVTGKLLGYVCLHCLQQSWDSQKLDRHVSSQHFGPIKCKICQVDQEDVQALQKHTRVCFYPCGVEGCQLNHKRLIEAQRHKRKFLRNLSV